MVSRNQDQGQQMYKDAPASEADWDKVSPPRSGGSASPKRDIMSLRAPPPEIAPEAERPADVPDKTAPPAEPAEKTERPAEPAEKEAKPGQQPAAKEEKPSEKPRKGFLRRRPLMAGAGLIALLAAGAATYVYWDSASHFESTDDAFIAARQFAIAPKVSGYVTEVPVTDNQHVVAGQIIARIDDRDYRTALEQAEAQVAADRAIIGNIDAQTTVQQAQIAQSKAQVEQSQATLTFAEQQDARYERLAQTGAGTVQNAQQYSSSLIQQRAALKTAQAGLLSAERQIDALKAQRSSAEANLAQANAQLDQARLNLSYTIVTAAQPGRVVNLGGAVGQYATAGTNLTMFVPDDLWVTANFKESQLDQMRPGQKTTLVIDAYPERVFHGHVASVQPGSGTAF